MHKHFLLDRPAPASTVDAVATLLDRPVQQIRLVLREQRQHRHDGYRVFRRDDSRSIMVPFDGLADLQRRLADRVLNTGPVSPAACAGIRGRSYVDAAMQHLADETDVLRLDVQKAFASTRYAVVSAALRRRLKPELWAMGLDADERDQVAGLLAHVLTAKHPREGYRCLPTGAPSSVAAFNLVCAEIDRDIFNWLEAQGETRAVYTRYVDDMVFSHVSPTTLLNLPAAVGKALRHRGLRLNDDKTMHMSGSRAEVYRLTRGQPGRLALVHTARASMAEAIATLRRYLAQPGVEPDARRHALARLGGIATFVQQIYGAMTPAELVVDMPAIRADSHMVAHTIDEIWQ
ncbi:MAG: reverse transcriptase domain-containing protein [Planctomycetota bacterium]